MFVCVSVCFCSCLTFLMSLKQEVKPGSVLFLFEGDPVMTERSLGAAGSFCGQEVRAVGFPAVMIRYVSEHVLWCVEAGSVPASSALPGLDSLMRVWAAVSLSASPEHHLLHQLSCRRRCRSLLTNIGRHSGRHSGHQFSHTHIHSISMIRHEWRNWSSFHVTQCRDIHRLTLMSVLWLHTHTHSCTTSAGLRQDTEATSWCRYSSFWSINWSQRISLFWVHTDMVRRIFMIHVTRAGRIHLNM